MEKLSNYDTTDIIAEKIFRLCQSSTVMLKILT